MSPSLGQVDKQDDYSITVNNIHHDTFTTSFEQRLVDCEQSKSITNRSNHSLVSEPDGPSRKKRKLTDPATQSRPVSPPWKKVTIDGPTSFVEGGRRKSSRTNTVPLELQPQADKRQTRAAIQQNTPIKSRYGAASHLNSTSTSRSSPPKLNISMNGSLHSQKSSFKSISQPIKATPAKSSGYSPDGAKTSTAPKSPLRRRLRTPSDALLKAQHNLPAFPSDSPKRKPGRPPRKAISMDLSDKPSPEGGKRKGQGYIHTESREANLRLSSEEKDEDSDEPVAIDPNYKPPQVKFKVHMPTLSVQHPGHVLPPRKHKSFQEWLNAEDPFGEDPSSSRQSDKQIRKEANLRRRIVDASKPGGLLTEERCSVYEPDPQEEPAQQYAHQDHLIAHAVYFRKLMLREYREHVAMAKRLAHAAAAFWELNRPKPKDEEQKLATEAQFKAMLKEMASRWRMVREDVDRQRLLRWNEEQQVLSKQALNDVLNQSTKMLNKRRRRGSNGESISGDDDDEVDELISETSAGDSEVLSGNEDNMTSSQSESNTSEEGQDGGDEILTVDELRKKYGTMPTENLDRPPDRERPTQVDVDTELGEQLNKDLGKTEEISPSPSPDPEAPFWLASNAPVEVEDVDELMLDGSDESTDMEDESDESEEAGTDDSKEDSDEDEDEEGEDSEGNKEATRGRGLLGFFTKEDLSTSSQHRVTPAQVDDDSSKRFQEVEDTREPNLIEIRQVPTPAASNSEAPSVDSHPELKSAARAVVSEMECLTPKEQDHQENQSFKSQPDDSSPLDLVTAVDRMKGLDQDSLPATPFSSVMPKTPVPSLLRGTLREYQHYGLDWLAGLYGNKTNGILADEMGLGKTIQTISLLAHLAEEHGIWGPHLIVVPTSVMLNWAVEFKKFLPGFKVLTYYGSIEERRKKRAGWLDDDKWHVVITSYQLVIQDAVTFKKRAWHYLILDEAHNIKNFRSQRWQTLLTFRTRARLLLTGTPLQNNLTELWSLMFFLMPSDSKEAGISGFADLQAFTTWFKKPVDQILEQGRENMDKEAKELVQRLHRVLRPYLLRRLKADVEKQMPGKYEHVIYCKLSKRQRYLYDGFMSRAATKEALSGSNYLSIVNCLMQLKKVCNHPDLFETRQIVTSYALPQSAVADFEIKELLVRKRLLQEDPLSTVNLDVVNLLPAANGRVSALETIQPYRLRALGKLRSLEAIQWRRLSKSSIKHTSSTIEQSLATFESASQASTYERLHQWAYLTSLRSQRRPLLSHAAIGRITTPLRQLPTMPKPQDLNQQSDWMFNQSSVMEDLVLDLPKRSAACATMIQKFACVTPAVIAPDVTGLTLTPVGIQVVQEAKVHSPNDYFHQSRMSLSIAFPDKRLLQYDCGKLQQLDALLRQILPGGHRALIFTQMSKVLDILEQFLNIHGHRYLRLDGATKVESRQLLADRFNEDDRIPIFILSSRAGGQGINLTGADTVIFYDMDWNPQMDNQCQDRCHRIGQTRDVHIYRLVSDHTIEKNILRTANRKRMLDNIIIQAGDFTTDHFNNPEAKASYGNGTQQDDNDAAGAAMDRVLGAIGIEGGMSKKVLEQVEDKEDVVAAKVAEKEIAMADEGDFTERSNVANAATPRSNVTPGLGIEEEQVVEDGMDQENDEELHGSQVRDIDGYCLRFLEWELQDVPMEVKNDKNKKAKKKGPEHRMR